MAQPLHDNFQYGQDANGPQAGGYNPTQGDMQRQALRDQVSQDARSYWLQQDQRAQFLSAAILNTTHGDGAREAFDSGSGRAMRQVVGSLVNSPMLAGMSGGNILDMYNGINTGMLNSGMSFGTIGGQGAYTYGGVGYMQDQVAKQLTRGVQENFFTATGGSRMAETSGMDRTEIGQIAAYMGLRGGFSGMGSAGDTREFRDKAAVQAELKRVTDSGGEGTAYADELQSLVDMDGDKGGVAFKINDQMVDKVNSKIREGAKALASVKDIIGDRGIGELADVAEKLTGLDITNVENARSVTERFRRIKTFSEANGLNQEAVLSEQIQIGQHLRANGLSKEASAISSEVVQQQSRDAFVNNRAARNALQAQGLYAPETSVEDMKAISSADVTSMLKSETDVAALAYSIQSSTTMTPEQKAAFRERLATLGSRVTGDSKEERKSSQFEEVKALESDLVDAGGMALGTVYDMAGGRDNVLGLVQSEADVRAMTRSALGLSQQRLLDNNLPDAINQRAFGSRFVEQGRFDEAATAQTFSRAIAEFDSSTTRNPMMRALRGDNPTEDFNKILQRAGVDEETKKALKDSMMGIVGVSTDEGGDLVFEGEGAENALAAMNEFAIMTGTNPMLGIYSGEETRNNNARGLIGAQLKSLAGSDTIAKGGFLEALSEGIFKGEDISKTMAMESAVLSGDGGGFLNIGKADNLFENLDAEQLKSLAGISGMGVDTLKDKMESDAGKLDVLNALKASGATVATSTEGNSFVAALGDEKVEEHYAKLRDTHKLDTINKLMGREVDYELDAEGELTKESKERYTKDFKARGKELVGGAYDVLIRGKGGEEQEAQLEALQNLDPAERAQMLHAEIATAKEKEDYEKVANLKALGRHLSGEQYLVRGEDFEDRSKDLVSGAYKAAIEGNEGFGPDWFPGVNGNTKDLRELQDMSPDARNNMINSRIDVARAEGDNAKAAGLEELKATLASQGTEVSLLTQIRDLLQSIEND